MPVGGKVGVAAADVVDQQNLVGIFGFVGLEGHKWLKNIKKILKKIKKKCGGGGYIRTHGGAGGGAPLRASASDSAQRERGTIAASVEHFHGSPLPPPRVAIVMTIGRVRQMCAIEWG